MVDTPILPLIINGAIVRKNGRTIIGPIDHEVTPEGLTIIMGPNGAGKTTLLRMMHGLERLSAGSVSWQAPESEARKRQAFVFQSPVMMRRSVIGNICFPLIIHGVARKVAHDLAHSWLERIGLDKSSELQASVLSVGERQKLSLARALIRKPQILFLDEPCANLDGRSTREIETLLQDAHADGVRIMMSTHHIGQARRLATDVMFVSQGLLRETADAGKFFSSPQTPEADAYLKGEIVE